MSGSPLMNSLDILNPNDASFVSSSSDASIRSDSKEAPVPLPALATRKFRKLLMPTTTEAASEIAEEVLRSLKCGECNLGKLRLGRVPDGLPIEKLKHLTLAENELTSLPAELFRGASGANLVRFDANSNALRDLPVELFMLPNLEVLLLDHNFLTDLPLAAVLSRGGRLLPALRRVGLEFNDLRSFPVEFFEHCMHLEEAFLGQNENMLDDPIPTARLRASPLAKRLARSGGQPADVLLKLDNRPRLVQQLERESWQVTLPWITVQQHKIYPDRVLGFLYLGSLRTAQTSTVYRDLNIGYILTVIRGVDVKVEPGMRQLVLAVEDLPGEDLRSLFDTAFEFIDEARLSGKGILLHCFAGLSRSVAIAAAYIMSRYGKTCDEAMELIRAARPAARPNPGFMSILENYEVYLQENEVKH